MYKQSLKIWSVSTAVINTYIMWDRLDANVWQVYMISTKWSVYTLVYSYTIIY